MPVRVRSMEGLGVAAQSGDLSERQLLKLHCWRTNILDDDRDLLASNVVRATPRSLAGHRRHGLRVLKNAQNTGNRAEREHGQRACNQ